MTKKLAPTHPGEVLLEEFLKPPDFRTYFKKHLFRGGFLS
ncbi:hypothetical protein HKBW3S34_01959, partial [Candidatus Hakubella thermalkaliphila]